MIIRDHLALPNLTGMNPLLGPAREQPYLRFLPLSDAYSYTLRRLAFMAANKLQLEDSALAEGTYAWVSGPTYETPAEGRFLRSAGADVVGMSTVPEVLAAREEGLNVMVMSLVTNFVSIPVKDRSIKEEVAAEVSDSKTPWLWMKGSCLMPRSLEGALRYLKNPSCRTRRCSKWESRRLKS